MKEVSFLLLEFLLEFLHFLLVDDVGVLATICLIATHNTRSLHNLVRIHTLVKVFQLLAEFGQLLLVLTEKCVLGILVNTRFVLNCLST